MTRDEIRNLIGGYATGTLAEAERKLLFEAALEDQELFDELVREQALKDLLDQPGARQRLLRVLAPARAAKKPLWARPWPWVSAAVAAAALIGVILFQPPKTREIAQVRAPAPRAAVPAAPAPVPAEERAAPPVAPAPAAVPKAREAENRIADAAPLRKTQEAAANQPAAEPAAAPDRLEVGQTQAAPAAPPAAGFRAAAPLAARPQVTAARFAFDYQATADGNLRITPAADGFLTVSVSGGGGPQTLFSNRAVQAGVLTEIALPAQAQIATVTLSAQPAPVTDSSGIIGGALDAAAGTKADPNPSAGSRLTAVIPLPRR